MKIASKNEVLRIAFGKHLQLPLYANFLNQIYLALLIKLEDKEKSQKNEKNHYGDSVKTKYISLPLIERMDWYFSL